MPLLIQPKFSVGQVDGRSHSCDEAALGLIERFCCDRPVKILGLTVREPFHRDTLVDGDERSLRKA